ncbi:MAG: alkaline phosphatase [Rhodospirillaceae bacterium]|nr:alkaline phosphatase [Rhodospirillaceae bacterium]|tara:strand:- start:7 stop:300 length:294 start_codon:yes stop_codon:yes gene_type:complete
MDKTIRLEIEAAAFRQLVSHFQENPEVQNIDLMDLAGFCRNCLSKWYTAAAEDMGVEMDYDTARNIVYGMPYKEWKQKYQTEQPSDRLKTFEPHEHE